MTRQRLRQGFLAVTITGVALWAGYTISNQAQAFDPITIVPEQQQTIESQYPDLPPAVARALQGVVSLQRVTGANDSGLLASGIILNNSQVLTAGHNTENGGNGVVCSNTDIDVPGYYSMAASARLSAITGSALYDKTNEHSTDLALLTVRADANFRDLPNAALASARPKAGDTVFLINFQPKEDGTKRSPVKPEARDPVVMSGVVLGSGKYGLLVATGGGQSYSHGDTEVTLRKGSSGGAVVNTRGELVGLSVSTESLQANRDAQYIASTYGVQLAEQQYQITHVQTLDSQLIAQLQSSQVACN